ncbi:hypothetical protein [Clostridium grantii]|uniref:Uncharacterized protein n=1 Tax=Clostridium grantii DSM 8605 TaxID=1121316 RepID=A0A1M5WP64_9CLOT|nr:hypothetical protein [Clostridium grantii]SHH89172.1 hypothetical protein SAMN02745207_03013 [Clostridium grantii DSM 8605]
MNLIEIKKDKRNILNIILILSIVNLPIFIYSIMGKYSVFRFVFIIAIVILTEIFLAIFINDMIFKRYFKAIDNAEKIISSKARNRIMIVGYVLYLAFYYYILFSIMSDSDYFFTSTFILYINIMNCFNIFNGQNILNVYKGDTYLLYANRIIENEKIYNYEVKILKKYKKDKKDKIQLTINIKGQADLVVFYSGIAYKIKDIIDGLYEERFIEEKMKEYGVTK